MTGSERPTVSVGLRVTPTRKRELDGLREELGFKEMTELLRAMIEDYLERRRNGSGKAVNRRPAVDIEAACMLFRKILEGQVTEVNEPSEDHVVELIVKG